MENFTINVINHKKLAVVATYKIQAWGITDAQHMAIRMAMADGHDWAANGGLFARAA